MEWERNMMEIIYIYIYIFFFLWCFNLIPGLGLPRWGFTITLIGQTTPGRLLWMIDQANAETSTWHTKLKRDKTYMRQWDLNPQSSRQAAVDLCLRLCPACQQPACMCVSRPLTWADKHVYVRKWGCPASQHVASECAKRMLWLVAATKLVCPLLPDRLCGRQR